ncbi:MAG: methylamine utilization protein MauG [gamma proteobacterium symbiont of Ctena orbiculata]|nr:MAG: methylamine utilization protein MauG [gamma proteobacterium symbiont of Ctena orbiculata]PVV18161.1 MAG: methylamine utilization protein MauG [gamma proteobacterium symbiont of Ctena orbiculata]
MADLLGIANNPPLGLPPVPVPISNPLTSEKIALGRKLFYDRRLSLNDTFSCAMCHVPEQGFTSNELAMAVGIEGRSVRRNSPTIYNTAYADLLFHDGREQTLEQQVWGPLLANNEMANPSVGYVLQKIRGIADYDGRFEAAFDGRGVSMETLGMAIASYERALVSGDSSFDRWYYAGDKSALSTSARRGFELFTGKAGCSACHRIGEKHALFSDDQLHNTGLGYRESMGLLPETQPVVVAPGVILQIDRAVIEKVGEPPPTDVGLYEVTQNPSDRWKYKTPSLRNVALTAPYMHNGTFSTLLEVVDFYAMGGVPNELLDPLIRPLGLTDREKQDLVAFLQSLTGSNVDTLVADAFAAPVGDVRKGDPSWVHGSEVEVR